MAGTTNTIPEIFKSSPNSDKPSDPDRMTDNAFDVMTAPKVPTKVKDPVKFQREIEFCKLAFGDKFSEINNLLKTGQDTELCGKLNVLKTLLSTWKEKKSKVLLFSYSTKNMDILERFLKKQRYSYSRLDGSSPMTQRQKIVDNFNLSPNKFVFLISTKAGGLGLNLVSANVVVVFDPNWNVTHDLQAQDRAYRIGQTKRTHVYRLISAGTIEEMIYNRQIYKQQVCLNLRSGSN